jgi:phosphoserine phosphatase
MRAGDPVLVFDLDGTVLRVNSFPVWVMLLACGGPRHLTLARRAAMSLRVQRLVLTRKLGGVPHGAFMHAMQALWREAAAGDGGTMTARLHALLLQKLRPNLAPVLKLVAEDGADGLLATAAAGDYAESLGPLLGLQHVIATPFDRRPDEPINNGARKRDRVLAFLDERGWAERPIVFFNDHLADLPLMLESRVVCWFGGRRALGRARETAQGVRFIDCRRFTPGEMIATLAHLRQSVAIEGMEPPAGYAGYAGTPRASTAS